MQRATQWVGANDRALGNGLLDGSLGGAAGAQPDGPERAEVVLRLDGAEPADGLAGAGERITTDALSRQALGGESDGEPSGPEEIACSLACTAWYWPLCTGLAAGICDCSFRRPGRTIPRLHITEVRSVCRGRCRNGRRS